MKFSKATVASTVLSTAALAPSTVFVEGRRTVPKWLREAYNNKDIPLDSGRDWITLPNGVEYQPGPIEDELNDPRMAKLRERSLGYSSSGNYNVNYNEGYKRAAYGNLRKYDGDANAMTTPFIDGSESYYDEFAQAWRALGWYIDCDNTFYAQADEDDDRDESSGCKRYLLWASYIDLDYEGNGMNEYMYFNRQSGLWSDKACEKVYVAGNNTANGQQQNQQGNQANGYYYEKNEEGAYANWNNNNNNNGGRRKLGTQYVHRCVKMDCHMPDTHYKLLGLFKEPHYDEWMEQLFKHQGDCVWSDGEYGFMQANRESWPNGCTATNYKTSDGTLIYYDLKPEAYGSMSIGLYTDSDCVVDYTGGYSVENILESTYYYKGDQQTKVSTVEKEIELWNDAFDVFKQCQPCKTFSLVEIVAGLGYKQSSYNSTGSRHFKNWDDWAYGNQRVADDNDYNANYEYYGGNYECHDDAGYDNVNQCMKFATHTKMVAAQFSDLMVATNQGTTTGFTMVGQGNFGQFPKAADGSMDAHFHRWWSNKNPDNSYKERKNEKSNAFKMNAIFLTGSIIYFVLASLWFYSTSVRANKKLKEPLMELDPTDYNDAMNVMHRDHESRSKEEFSPPKMVAVTAMKIY